MSNWRRWVRPGLALTFVLAILAVVFRTGAIEGDLGDRVAGRLAAEGHDWARVEVSGRSVTVVGTAPSPESQGMALAVARAVEGVGTAADGTDLLPVASPYVWAARRQGGTVTLSGSTPSESTRNSVLAAARRAFPEGEIRDQMALARGVGPGFNAATSFALDRLAGLTEGVITVTDGILSVSGVAASSSSYSDARSAFLEATPQAVTLGPVDVLPARADPFVWSASYDGTAVTLDGFVPNEVVHETLVATARAVLGHAQIVDQMRVASGEPKGFAEAAGFAIGALARLREGGVALDGLNLDIAGAARSVDDYEGIVASLGADVPAGLQIAGAIRPAPVSPYGWVGEKRGNAVFLTGYVPSLESKADVKATAEALFAGLTVTDSVRVAAGEPKMDWIGAVKFGMSQLAKLGTGSVTLGDRTFTIEGEAASPEAFADLMAMGDRTLPASLELATADVLPPRVSPYLFVAERAPEKVTLSGYVPAAQDKQSILDTARRQFGKVEIVDRLAYASGAPGEFVEAATTALEAVARLAGGRAEIVDTSVRIDGGVYSPSAAEEIVGGTTESLPKGFRPVVSVVTRQPGQPLGPAECRNHLQRELQTGRIEFEGSKAQVSRDSFGLLDRVASTLVRCPDTRIEIAAHSDSDGSTSRNRDLTQARAEAIVDYLVDSGVARERLAAIGQGETSPIAENDTPEGKAANRRIEFTMELPEGG